MPTTARRRGRTAALALVTVSTLLLGACAAAVASSGPAPRQPAATAAPEDRTATLAFAGDVHFEGASSGTADLGGAFSVLRDADLSVVNLETAVTERGAPAAKQYLFRAPRTAVDALAASGVDAVSVANNHAMDYGPLGMGDTLAAGRAAGVQVLGAGSDRAAALTPWRTAPQGVRVSVLAATDVLDTSLASAWTATPTTAGMASAKDERHLLAAVRAERSRADVVVVFLHWGVERERCPSARQQHLARELAAAGADVVVGSHAHVLQPLADVDGALVAYGLGNFHFYATDEPFVSTGVLTVTVARTGVVSHAWHPATITGGRPETVADPVRTGELDRSCPAPAAPG